MKHLLLILMSIIGLGSVSAQSQNVKCTYAATHVISDAVKNIEDAHIRKMMIQKFQNDKKTFTMLYADGKYSFSEGSNGGDTGIKWRKRSIPTHSEWLYPLTFDAGKGLKEA